MCKYIHSTFTVSFDVGKVTVAFYFACPAVVVLWLVDFTSVLKQYCLLGLYLSSLAAAQGLGGELVGRQTRECSQKPLLLGAVGYIRSLTSR